MPLAFRSAPPADPDAELRTRLDRAERLRHATRGLGVYLALAAALVAATALTLLFGDHPWVERFGPNVATEILGIIITLVFVQRMLEREERVRRLRVAVGALRRARGALSSLVDTWSELVKAGLDPRRTEWPRTAHQLFAPYYTEELACLDPGRGEWLVESALRLASARRTIQEVIHTYGATLDADYLEVLAELVDDPFASLVQELAEGPPLGPEEWRQRINRSRGHLAAHFVRLDYAARVHNRLAREAGRFRSRHLAPAAQLMSVQLHGDRDLAFETDLPPGWWSEAPRVGSLRTRHDPA